MTLKTDAVGKEWPGTTYQVGREKIKEYATALGIDNPVHFDVEAARAADVRRRLQRARPGPGAVRPRRRHELRGDGPRRPGLRVGRAGLLRRRDHDRLEVPLDRGEGRQGLLRLRD